MAAEALAVEWVAAVCMTLLIYDNIITFGQEVSTMWLSRWSIPKVLFLLNRYLVVGMLSFNAIASSQTHLPNDFCIFYLRWLVCTITVTNSVVEGILVARVWALYRENRIAVAIALTFYFSGICVLVGLTVADYIATGPVEAVDDFQQLPGCYARTVPSLIAGYWISPLIIESIFFMMVVWRAAGWWRTDVPVPPTLVLLARDSSVYFLIVFVLLFANLFVFLYGPPFLSSMLVTPSNTAGCIAGSRMLLNMRNLAYGHTDEATTDIEMSGLRFKTRISSGFRSRRTETTSSGMTTTFGASTIAESTTVVGD